MKTQKLTENELVLYKPHEDGEMIFGFYDDKIETENGFCAVLVQNDGSRLAVPITQLLEEKFQNLTAGEEYILLVFLGLKEGKNYTYKRFSVFGFIPDDEDEEEYLTSLNISSLDNLHIEENGAWSDAIVTKNEDAKNLLDIVEVNAQKLLSSN